MSESEKNSYDVNIEANIDCIYVGDELTPILICDDTLTEKNELISYAINESEFTIDKSSYYPGYKSTLPTNYVRNVVSAVVPVLQKIYKINYKKISIRAAFYSFVSKQPRELSLPQRHPHIDSSYSKGFAMLHYLNDGDFGGTGFFRHRSTGFERLSEIRSKGFSDIWAKEIELRGEPQLKYFSQSDETFELMESVNYKPNRLLVYPSNIFHSGLINENYDIHSSPDKSRLTANIFLDFV